MYKLMLIIICTVLFSWYVLPIILHTENNMHTKHTVDTEHDNYNKHDNYNQHDWGGQTYCQENLCHV